MSSAEEKSILFLCAISSVYTNRALPRSCETFRRFRISSKTLCLHWTQVRPLRLDFIDEFWTAQLFRELLLLSHRQSLAVCRAKNLCCCLEALTNIHFGVLSTSSKSFCKKTHDTSFAPNVAFRIVCKSQEFHVCSRLQVCRSEKADLMGSNSCTRL